MAVVVVIVTVVIMIARQGFAWTDPAGTPPFASPSISTSGGNVGIGTASPAYKLDVVGDIHASGTYYPGNNSGAYYFKNTGDLNALSVIATGGASISTGVTGNGTTAGVTGQGGQFGVQGVGTDIGVTGNGGNYGMKGLGAAIGIYAVGTTANATGVFALAGLGGIAVYGNGTSAGTDFKGFGGEYAKAGSWTNISDRNVKENFVPIDGQSVLDKIAQLPITQWNYKTAKGVKHIGPVAQDFYAIFGVGDDDKHISTIDPAGISLAGIKALNEKVNAQQKQIRELEDEIKNIKK